MLSFILAQIFGFVALILVCIGYFLKSKTSFLMLTVFANFFYALAFFVVGAFVGGALTFISIGRCLYLYFAEKHNFKYTLHFLSIFIVLYIASTIIFWASPLDLMAILSSSFFTLGYAIKNMQTMRYVLLIPNSLLVIYNILATTYTSAILDFIEIIVIIVAIIQFAKHKKDTKLVITN